MTLVILKNLEKKVFGMATDFHYKLFLESYHNKTEEIS